jgi:hypothetical protein
MNFMPIEQLCSLFLAELTLQSMTILHVLDSSELNVKVSNSSVALDANSEMRGYAVVSDSQHTAFELQQWRVPWRD